VNGMSEQFRLGFHGTSLPHPASHQFGAGNTSRE
jgi:hypothetical protein